MTKPFAIPKALVRQAFQRVKANGGSAGVDNESIDAFEMNLGDNLYKLWNRMGSGSYFPPPVKAVPIPKKSGGTRTLGVPTVADRVAQTWSRWSSSRRSSQSSTATHLATDPGAPLWTRWRW
jgi:RNA-directed DNA polymerase